MITVLGKNIKMTGRKQSHILWKSHWDPSEGGSRLRSIHLIQPVGVMSMGGSKWKLEVFFSVRRMKTASSDAMGQPVESPIWKILEILKSELVNLFGLYAVLEQREVHTFKSLVFTLLKSFCSSSKFDRAGFKCLSVFPTGHFCCFGTRAHAQYSSINGKRRLMQL